MLRSDFAGITAPRLQRDSARRPPEGRPDLGEADIELPLQDTAPSYQRCPEKHHGSHSQVRRPARTRHPSDAGAGNHACRTVDWAYALIRSVLVPNNGRCSASSWVGVAARVASLALMHGDGVVEAYAGDDVQIVGSGRKLRHKPCDTGVPQAWRKLARIGEGFGSRG